jgi:DNA-directed RNA polymerase specialized sigma24 family protein
VDRVSGTDGRLDHLFPAVCQGDEAAFEAWMTEVEIPLRGSLGPFARAVDVESVVQETLLRVWVFALERGHTLEGRNASLRWAIGVARNVARNEARRNGRMEFLPPEELPEVVVEPFPTPDPALARLVRGCFEALTEKPRRALEARVERGHIESDRTLAEAVGMTLNTFLKNIGRARTLMADCLRDLGAPIEEFLP